MADRNRFNPDRIHVTCPVCQDDTWATLEYEIIGEDRPASSTGPAEHAELHIVSFFCDNEDLSFGCGTTDDMLQYEQREMLLDEVDELLQIEAEPDEPDYDEYDGPRGREAADEMRHQMQEARRLK